MKELKEIDFILDRLRAITKASTDKELCEILDINYSTLDTWKNNNKIPDKRLLRISQKLSIRVNELTKNDKYKNIKNYKEIKEVLGNELVENICDIEDDANKLQVLYSLCSQLINKKIDEDFEKMKDLLFFKEKILISINGSKYLNRFTDFDASFDETNNLIIITVEITIGKSLRYNICDVIKRDSIFHCKDEDGEIILIEFVTVILQ